MGCHTCSPKGWGTSRDRSIAHRRGEAWDKRNDVDPILLPLQSYCVRMLPSLMLLPATTPLLQMRMMMASLLFVFPVTGAAG